MPFYAYKCNACENEWEKLLSVSECGVRQCCPACSSDETRKVVTKCQVIFKGDGWVDKNGRIKTQMARKNRVLGEKQKKYKGAKLVPNVGGEQVDSWSDAQKLAKSKGKKAETYTKQVRKEQATR